MIVRFLKNHILLELEKVGICGKRQNVWIWNGSSYQFQYLCWYVTAIGELNGLKMFQGEKRIQIKTFQEDVVNVILYETNGITQIKEGLFPKKDEDVIRCEEIRKATETIFAKIIRNPKLDIPKKKPFYNM